jgi:L-lactate permease
MIEFMYYLIIGTLFTLIIDILCYYLDSKKYFNNIERVVVILLWPISLIVFLRYFFFKI